MLIFKKRRWLGEFSYAGIDKILQAKWFAHDTETTGLNIWKPERSGLFPARPFFFSFADEDQNTAWIRLPVDPVTREVGMPEEARRLLSEIYGRKDVSCFAHNAVFDHHMVSLSGIPILCTEFCTLIASQIITPDEMQFGLKYLCKKYFQVEDTDEKDLATSVNSARSKVRSSKDPWISRWALSEEPKADKHLGTSKLLEEYAVTDAVRVVALRIAQLDHFKNNDGLSNVYVDEMRLLQVIIQMEEKGIRVDTKRATELSKFYSNLYQEHNTAIEKECPGLNTNSPLQMVKHFFGERKKADGTHYVPLKYSTAKDGSQRSIPCQVCKPRGKQKHLPSPGCQCCQFTGRNPKCDGDFLEKIAIERKDDKISVVDSLAYHILHTKAAGTMSNYVTQYLDLSVEESSGRILRPHFKQSEAKTGRMACEQPNLQNVASDESGKKKVDIPYRSREVFIPRDGCLFHIPDYSQIEVWILALLSKDENFIKALCSGSDAHLAVAKIIWPDGCDFEMAKVDKNKRVEDLSSDRRLNLKRYNGIRKRAKNLQFCKIYGGGAAKIASMVGCSVEEARKFIRDYDLRLPAVPRFMEESIKMARVSGVVVDPYGRNYHVQPGFEYRATNYLVQGTAAQVMKSAMRRVNRLLSTKWENQAGILLQIHDELLIEVDKNIDCFELRKDIVEAMAYDYKFLNCPIPFPIGYKIATERWSLTQEVEVAA